jgi:glutaredoxin 3
MTKLTPILFTQTGCADSGKVRDWLTKRGVEFVERTVTGDLDAAKALMATGTFATPLLVVGDQTVFGMRPDELAAVLSSSTQADARIPT